MKKWNELSYNAQERIVMAVAAIVGLPASLAMLYACMMVGVMMAGGK